MFKFFEFILQLIEYIIYFVITVIDSVVLFFKHIISGIAFLLETISFLPPFCRGALLAVLGVSIITALISAFVDVG